MPRSERSAVAAQLLDLAEHQVGEGERIDAHVQQRRGAERGVEHPVGGVGVDAEAELRVQVVRCPELAGGQASAQLADHRVARRPHRLHEEAVVLAGEPDHLLGVGGVEGDRLLAEHVLAGLEAQPGVVQVEGVGRRDVDDVDGRVGHQLLVGAVRRGRAVLAPRMIWALSSRRDPDRREPGARHQREVAGEGLGDLAGRQDAPTDVLADLRLMSSLMRPTLLTTTRRPTE